jgi:signal transduction histidine kinase/CheY-like chemotaxis protein
MGVMIYLTLIFTIPAVSVVSDKNIERGELNLREQSGFDYERDLFLLNGEWEYYPNQLLFSDDFADGKVDNVRYVRFPHYWRDDSVNFPDGKGFATYRIVVSAPVEADGMGVFSEFQYGAYRIFLNGQLVSKGGAVSENPDEHYFAYNGDSGYIRPAPGGYYEVIVHVQCYDHIDAGLSNNIIMGAPDSIIRYSGFMGALVGLSGGAVMVLILYFLILFIRNTDKSEYLNFAILSFCALYFVLTIIGRGHAYYLVPAISSRLIYALEHITPIAGAYFASVHVIKKHIKYKHAVKITAIYTAVHCILLALLSSYQVSLIRVYSGIAAMAIIVTAFVISLVFTINGRRRNDENYLLLEPVSLLVLILSATVNRLGLVLFIGFDLFPVGVIIFCFMQIFVLSGYYSAVGKDLVALTKTLENRVAERTAALVEVNRRVEAANEIKSEFLTRMSHEMRTPMNAIVGMSELFDTGNLSETQKNYFKDIKETSHSLLNLINDILDFSRIEAGKLELVPSHFCFSTFIDDICTTAKFSADIKTLSFECAITENLPDVIYGDENRMKQVIVNIISNAYKYTNEGGVKFEVSTATKPQSPESMLLFTIRDTGIGMRKENIPRMFDAFMNPNSTRSRGLKGIGLGLAICKRLMEMQKGAIEFDSEEGKGSVFRLYFPLKIGNKELVEETHVNEKIYAKNAKILLVEDNTINVTVALGILAAHDIRPDVAKDAYKALSMVKEKDYDLIFMDQFMPSMDGIEATQRIREMGGKNAVLPIIAMTANAAQGVRDMLIFKGMNDYLSKPVDHNQLNDILIRWLPHDKICSSLGRFDDSEQKSELFNELPRELVEISEINCSAALKNMDGNVEIYIGLLRQLVREADDYSESLFEYLKAVDFVNYIIVINGVKSLLYNIGAKACGDMAARLEEAACEKNEQYCDERTDTFCKSLRWLSQRISLALPHESKADTAEKEEIPHESVKLTVIMQKLSLALSIGDCDTIDGYIEILKEDGAKSDGEQDEVSRTVSAIIRETQVMEYEKAAELCSGFLETSVNKQS